MGRKYDKFKFIVEIDGFAEAGFMKAGPMKSSVEEVLYREGGSEFPEKDPGIGNVENLILEKGATDNDDMYDWFSNIVTGAVGEGGVDKRNISIVQQDRSGNELERWNNYNVFPLSFQAGDHDASDSTKNIRSIELAISTPWEKG